MPLSPASPVTGADIGNLILVHYIRGKLFLQNVEQKPLIRILNRAKETFPGGGGSSKQIGIDVQGAFMSDTSGTFAGYADSTTLTFYTSANTKQALYTWYEVFQGLVITETELKQDGISINDPEEVRENAGIDPDRIISVMKSRLEDFTESWSRSFNLMLWKDGSQDSKQIPGVSSIIFTAPTAGTTGGLDRAANTWWQNRASLNIQSSPTNQTLTQTLRLELMQLRRYGGRPNIALCGSDFINALQQEVSAKGYYTQEGFTNEGRTDMGMAVISLTGLGKFEYDPTLDDLAKSKFCYIIDDRRLKLRPMKGEENKVRKPTRPYDQLVWLHGMTYTGAMTASQLNCHGVYSIA